MLFSDTTTQFPEYSSTCIEVSQAVSENPWTHLFGVDSVAATAFVVSAASPSAASANTWLQQVSLGVIG